MQSTRKNPFCPLMIIIILMTSVSLRAQQNYRSDTINFSVQLRYLILSFGGGVEFPFRNHSFGLQVGQNYIPPGGNWTIGFNVVKMAAIEYKKYVNQTFYYGSYVLYNQTDYESPEEGVWDGEWSESESANLGALAGVKFYRGRRIYLELFAGLHFGWQWGQLNWEIDS